MFETLFKYPSLEMKAKALAMYQVIDQQQPKTRWRDDPDLMTFLRSL
jgi:hypothetical protein